MFKLVIQDDEGKTTVVPLIRDEITIGRKEGNTIRLTERNVSRRHARILRNNGEVQIEDLGSYNGIRVNNARIAERVNLRVSDQVQIGDYKLYLKAEGVEQVDDARTMPIERVDAGAAPTTELPAVAVPAPTQPVAIPQAAAAAANGSTQLPTPAPGQIPPVQIVGNPNRTMVAVADTDPDGRPRARPEHIAAAIPQTVGYGKLVVLSSNFAGKEFELSRPQMIIGRTDENDLVVNHRSISRNHAKVVREPDTQRYTISDLQSSNGVRVNGQDYGKVELRRGDVIDLGHVRLRFVEPGEDFVFSRDAVITDVPESGSKKGLLVAIILGLLVLGGVVVFFVMKGGKDDDKPTRDAGSGTNGVVEIDAGSGTVAIGPNDAAESNPPLIDGPAVGPSNPDRDKVALRCNEAQDARKWDVLSDCGRELKGPDGDVFVARATAEAASEVNLRNLRAAIAKPDVKEASRLRDLIPSTSVYNKEAQQAFDKLRKDLFDTILPDLTKLAKDRNCTEFNNRIKQFENVYGKTLADELRGKKRCTEKDATPPPNPCANCGKGYSCVNNACVKDKEPPPTNICADTALVAELESKGDVLLGQGSFAAALPNFEKIIKCKPGLLSKIYLAACRGKSFQVAYNYFKNFPAGRQDSMAQICMKEGYDPRKGPP